MNSERWEENICFCSMFACNFLQRIFSKWEYNWTPFTDRCMLNTKPGVKLEQISHLKLLYQDQDGKTYSHHLYWVRNQVVKDSTQRLFKRYTLVYIALFYFEPCIHIQITHTLFVLLYYVWHIYKGKQFENKKNKAFDPSGSFWNTFM